MSEIFQEKDISSKEESVFQEIVQEDDIIYEKEETKDIVYYKITLIFSNESDMDRIYKLNYIPGLFNKSWDWFDGEMNKKLPKLQNKLVMLDLLHGITPKRIKLGNTANNILEIGFNYNQGNITRNYINLYMRCIN